MSNDLSFESSRPSSIIEVAKFAGTSVATVSRVFNKSSAVRKETADRIIEIANKLNYRPDAHGRSLRSGKHWNVGVLAALGGINDVQFNESMITHLVRWITAGEYGVSLEFLERVKVRKLVRPELLAANKVDGIIIVGHLEEDELQQIAKWGTPVCLMENLYEYPGFCSVNLAHKNGSMEAMLYLNSLGHKNIGFVHGSLEWPSTRERYNGYFEALEKFGLSNRPEYVVKVHENQQNYSGGYLGTLQLLKQAPDITAIFYVNDWYAVGGMAAIQSTGRRIPDDVSVIGYDNHWMAAEVLPSLTTVSEEIEELCHAGVKLLMHSIEHNSGMQSNIVVRPNLVVRKSCMSLKK